MANIKTDDNQVPTIAGLLDSDGATITRVKANPSTNIVASSNASTGSDNGGDRAIRDDNGRSVMIAVSSSDGSTPVALYVDSNGNLLIDSN